MSTSALKQVFFIVLHKKKKSTTQSCTLTLSRSHINFFTFLPSAPSAQLRQLVAAAGNKVTRFSRHNQRNVT